MDRSEIKIIARDKKVFHNYNLMEKYEAGLELKGGEIKSVREGKVSIKDGFVRIVKGEAFLYGVNISEYQKGNYLNIVKAERPKKLLLHKSEINRIMGRITEKGLTAVVTAIYLRNGYAKAEVWIGKGKKIFDKRREIALFDAQREIQSASKLRH